MRKVVIATTLLGSALLILAAVMANPANTTPSVDAKGGRVQVTGVRAEWAQKVISTVDDIRTVIRMVNRSATHPITLGPIAFVGPDGAASPLSIYTGLQNQQIGPLATINLPVDGRILGLGPRQTRLPASSGDVTTAIVTWSGPTEALHLTSLIRYFNNDNYQYNDYLGCVIAEGFEITFGDE